MSAQPAMGLQGMVAYSVLGITAATNILRLRECFALAGLFWAVISLLAFIIVLIVIDKTELGGASSLQKGPFSNEIKVWVILYTGTVAIVSGCLITSLPVKEGIPREWQPVVNGGILCVVSLVSYTLSRMYMTYRAYRKKLDEELEQSLGHLMTSLLSSSGLILVVLLSAVFTGKIWDRTSTLFRQQPDANPVGFLCEAGIGSLLMLLVPAFMHYYNHIEERKMLMKIKAEDMQIVGGNKSLHHRKESAAISLSDGIPVHHHKMSHGTHSLSKEGSQKDLMHNIKDKTPGRLRSASLIIDMHQQKVLSNRSKVTTTDTFTEKLEIFFAVSSEGLAFDIYQFAISAASCIHYLWWSYLVYDRRYLGDVRATFYNEESCTTDNTMHSFFVLHYFFVFNFCLDYVFHLYSSRSKVNYFWEVSSIVDILVIVPVLPFVFRWLLLFMDDMDDIETPRMIEAFQFLRFLRLLKYAPRLVIFHYDWYSNSQVVSDAWKKVGSQILYVVLQILALFLCTAGLIFALEFNVIKSDHSFNKILRCLYYTIVTLASVGYGDISPTNDATRLTVMMIIIGGIAIVPISARVLMNALADAKVKASWTVPYEPTPGFSHVVICGKISMNTLNGLVDELLHEDHDLVLKVVLLGTEDPSEEVQAAMSVGRFANRVTYIRSSSVTWEALKSAKAESALACVIYNSMGETEKEKDATSIYNIITIKKFRSLHKNMGIPTLIIAEATIPKNRHRLEAAGADIVLSFASMKCRLLGRSLITPGLSTIVCNLLASGADEGAEVEFDAEEERSKRKAALNTQLGKVKNWNWKGLGSGTLSTPEPHDIESPKNDTIPENAPVDEAGGALWLEQYTYGMQHEVYRVRLNRHFAKLNFATAAAYVYSQMGITLFAVQKFKKKTNGTGHTLLFPGSQYKISAGDYGYVIATDAKECRLIQDDEYDIQTVAKEQDERERSEREKADDKRERGGGSFDSSDTETKHKGPGLEGDDSADKFISNNDVPSEPPSPSSRSANHSQSMKSVNSEDTSYSVAGEVKDSIDDDYLSNRLDTLAEGPEDSDAFASLKVMPKQTVEEPAPPVDRHLVICVEKLTKVHVQAIKPLRENNLNKLQHVVILTASVAPQVEDELSLIPNVSIVVANHSFTKKDFQAADMKYCESILILSNASDEGNLGEADMQTIFIWLSIRDYVHKSTLIVLEVNVSGSLRYVDPTSWWPGKMTRRTHYFAPTYAAGRTLLPMCLELMIAQAIFNPTNIECLEILMSASDTFSGKPRPANSSRSSSSAFLLPIPKAFHGSVFGELLSIMTTKHDILPIALYCGTGSSKGNSLPFVYTNPEYATVLFPDDQVYVLAKSDSICENVWKLHSDKKVVKKETQRQHKPSIKKKMSVANVNKGGGLVNSLLKKAQSFRKTSAGNIDYNSQSGLITPLRRESDASINPLVKQASSPASLLDVPMRQRNSVTTAGLVPLSSPRKESTQKG